MVAAIARRPRDAKTPDWGVMYSRDWGGAGLSSWLTSAPPGRPSLSALDRLAHADLADAFS